MCIAQIRSSDLAVMTAVLFSVNFRFQRGREREGEKEFVGGGGNGGPGEFQPLISVCEVKLN